AAGADFAVYYVAGWMARGEGKRSLYEGTPNDSIRNSSSPWLHVAHAHGVVATTPFQYPPFFALLMRPLTKLPLKSAFFAWRQLSAGFVLIAIYIALLMSRNKQRLPLFAMVAAAMLASFPFIEMKEMGQVGGLLLLLWTAGAYFADKDRPVAGAFCFAVGTMVKLTPAFVVPLFILRRQWRWLAAYTAWMTALFSISVWQLGWSNHVMFFTRFLPAMSCGFPSAANKSLVNIVQSLYYGNSFRDVSHLAAMPPIVCAIGKALSAAVLIGVLIAFYRRTKDAAHIAYEVALLALVSLL